MVTVDVESEWEQNSARAVREHLPPLLERFERRGIHSTLFCTGEIVEKCGDMLQEAGVRHELASHAVSHRPFKGMDLDTIRSELVESRSAVASLGRVCRGFRAPYFYMNAEILHEVARAGYVYDSSWASFGLHIGYHNLWKKKQPVRLDDPPIVEIPIPDATVARIPCGLSYYRAFHPVSRLYDRKVPHLVYMHCDEFLEEGPSATIPRPFRPLFNRNRGRRAWLLLERLLDSLVESRTRFMTCSEFVKSLPEESA